MVEPGGRDLIAIVREKLAAGALPDDAPTRMWVGYGTLRPCTVCDEPIAPAEIEYEFDTAKGQTVRCHRKCLEIWQEERRRNQPS
jgi:hypothetical protein